MSSIAPLTLFWQYEWCCMLTSIYIRRCQQIPRSPNCSLNFISSSNTRRSACVMSSFLCVSQVVTWPNMCIPVSGGAVTQRTQPAQHPQNPWEDADGKQKSVGVFPGDRRATFCTRLTRVCVCPAASPYYRNKLRGLYTTAKADAEAECGSVQHADCIAVQVFFLFPKCNILSKIFSVGFDHLSIVIHVNIELLPSPKH